MKEPAKSQQDNPAPTFPSHFIAPTEKRGKNWCRRYVEAFHNEAAHSPSEVSLSRNNSTYTRMRKYARGEQSENQYKELLGLKKDKGAINTSFRNLNFEILKIAPKLRNVLVNKVLNNPYRIQVKPIDPASINERQQQKSRLLEFLVSQEQIQAFENLTKLGLEKPIGPGEMPPQSMNEIEPWLDMNPKNAMSMEVKDYVALQLDFNNWKELAREIVGNIVDVGIGGTIAEVDSNNQVRLESIIPERAISNKCIYPDFRDLIRFGQYSEITVSELKRQTKGEWGEEVYKGIAAKVAQGGQEKYSGPAKEYWSESSYSYAYDVEKVTILKAMWYSTDTEVQKEYSNGSGNKRIKQMEWNYKPFAGDPSVNGGKGMSDEEYNKVNEGKVTLYRKEIKNVYRATWVVGTEHVYNHGLLNYMPRSIRNIGETQMPVSIYTTDFISTMGLIEQPLDQAQLNWLQFQSHVAASKPPGIAIEKKALARVGVGGKSGKKWDPKEDLIMYAEIGSIVYDGYDGNGNPLSYMPIKELKNGMSPAAQEHFAIIIQMIDLMRNILGLNALTEGQTPPERMGKQVAQMAWGASDNALSHLNDAFRSIYERTCKNMVSLMQSSISDKNKESMTESLGSETFKFFSLNNELSLREMGITLEEGPDDDLRNRISILVQKAVDNKEINPEDAIYIEMEDNIYRAIQMLKKARRERETLLHNNEKEKITLQADEQTKMAVATEQEKAKNEAAIIDREERKLIIESQLRQQEADKQFLQQLILKKLDREQDLDDQDNEFIQEVMKMTLKGKLDIEKEKSKPKPKPAATTKT